MERVQAGKRNKRTKTNNKNKQANKQKKKIGSAVGYRERRGEGVFCAMFKHQKSGCLRCEEGSVERGGGLVEGEEEGLEVKLGERV